MPKDNENIRLPFVGPVTPTEPHGFQPEQMIRCEECLRANPPTRVNCLYCAAALPAIAELQSLRKPVLRPPERHQPGYNVIFKPSNQGSLAKDIIGAAAGLLKLAVEDLERIIAAGVAMPVARTASREDAELAHERLSKIGLRTIVLADADFGSTGNMVTRVRSLELDDEGFTIPLSGGNDATRSNWSNVMLVVVGRVTQKTVEVTERKSRKAENEILNKSEFHTDETLVDFYIKESLMTWRISTSGFDFSCLGEEKTLLANENIGRLRKLICLRSPVAIIDDSYTAMRQTLELVWASDQETLSRGWRREGPGRISLGAALIMSDESQFTMYSRLRFYFCMKSMG